MKKRKTMTPKTMTALEEIKYYNTHIKEYREKRDKENQEYEEELKQMYMRRIELLGSDELKYILNIFESMNEYDSLSLIGKYEISRWCDIYSDAYGSPSYIREELKRREEMSKTLKK